MFNVIEKAVLGMVILRFISGSIEVSAALLMYRFNDIEKAVMINSLLAVVGPIALISTTAIGLVGLSNKVSFSKIALVFLGVGIIIFSLLRD